MRRRITKNRFRLLVLLWLVTVASFFLPWVSFPSKPDYAGVTVSQTNYGKMKNSILVRSISHICVQPSTWLRWSGFQIPGILWNLENNRVGGVVFAVSGNKNVKYNAILLYAYPLALMVCLWVMKKRKYIPAVRIGIACMCFIIFFIQVFVVGGKNVGSLPVHGYLDYGYWLGAVAFCCFGILIVR